MTDEAGAAPQRERGWIGPILATLALLMLPATPLLRIVLPVDRTLVLLAPALAVAAVAGWRAGGRLPLALFWTLFAVWVLVRPGSDLGAFTLLAAGWSVIVAAVFGALTIGGVGERFLPRALMAVGASLVVGTLVAVIASGGVAGAWEVLTAEIDRRASLSQAQWQLLTGSDAWLDLVRETPDAQRISNEVERQLAAAPATGRLLFPALLALESLATLAIAWAVYHRIGRARLGPPLARLRDFRFDDALVWGVIAGMVLVVLMGAGPYRAVGINLLVFFGALYALRGLGVMLWFLAPGRWMSVVFVIFTVLFWYLVGAVAVGVGLGDTWFDWRRRVRPKSQRSE